MYNAFSGAGVYGPNLQSFALYQVSLASQYESPCTIDVVANPLINGKVLFVVTSFYGSLENINTVFFLLPFSNPVSLSLKALVA
ncbi:hypothetical protein BH18THE2_BH18THE2_20920 [soil metagenome]